MILCDETRCWPLAELLKMKTSMPGWDPVFCMDLQAIPLQSNYTASSPNPCRIPKICFPEYSCSGWLHYKWCIHPWSSSQYLVQKRCRLPTGRQEGRTPAHPSQWMC